MNCHKCGDKVDMNAGHVCLTGNDRLKERITYLQARIAELEHKLANYQAAADGDTHWCAECKMKDERIAELEKELRIYDEAIRDCAIDRSLGGNRPVSEYIADARKNLSAPPEEVSNET